MKEKKWYEISFDELMHRMTLQKKYRTDPASETIKMMFRAVDKLLEGLGVNTEDEESIADQMENLGIIMMPNTEEVTPQLNGYFFFLKKKRSIIELDQEPDIVPYGWVSAPKMKKDGTAYCETQIWGKEKLVESEPVKVV